MKTSITTIVILVLTTTLSFAQEEEPREMKTLFSKGASVRGFGALETKYSEINTDHTIIVGAKGGVIINKHFTVGLAGYGMSSINKFDGIDPNQELYLYGGYAGLLLGYNIFPKEIIHINFPVLIGAGGFHVSDRNYYQEIRNDNEIRTEHSIENSSALVIEPGIEVEINVTKFFRIGLGSSYRLVSGVTLDRNNITDSDLSNWSTHASLKFGKFW